MANQLEQLATRMDKLLMYNPETAKCAAQRETLHCNNFHFKISVPAFDKETTG